jgi:hypothetical protein
MSSSRSLLLTMILILSTILLVVVEVVLEVSIVVVIRVRIMLLIIVMLIIVGVIQYFMYNYLVITKLVLVVLAALFALYIVHTTNNILLRDYEGDFITASFDYYIDMSNFFYALKVDPD